ncbi:MAG: ArnT family glycosyltransferase [Terracidiphilus sp.]
MNTTAARKPFLISTPLVGLGIRSERSIVRHERRYLLLALAIFTLVAAYHACTVPLWFDEFFTLFISRLASLPEMLRAMPADGQPPLQYLLTHLSLRLFGATELAVRLPELLAYMAAGLLTYRIVRRHGTAIQALFALAFLLASIVGTEQAYTARPYGLLIAFTALVFVCWQTSVLRQHHRFLPLCGVSLGIAGAVLSHHFGVIHTGLLLGAGETTRLIQRRRLDGHMVAAIGVGLSPLAVTLPLARQSHLLLGEAILHSSNFWAKPSLTALWRSYLFMTAPFLLCLVAGLAFLPWPGRTAAGHTSPLSPVPAHEWAATGALCVLLPVQFLLAAFGTGYFHHKYAVSCSLGLALFGAWALPRLRLGRLRIFPQPALALSTLCYLLLVAATLSVDMMHQPMWNARPGAKAVSSVVLKAPDELPIVVDSSFDYPQEWCYAPPSLKQRFTYLFDNPYALQQTDFLAELSLTYDRAYIPLPISNYASFLEDHPHFLLLRSGISRFNWTDSRLASAGWHLTPIASSGEDVLFQVDAPPSPIPLPTH